MTVRERIAGIVTRCSVNSRRREVRISSGASVLRRGEDVLVNSLFILARSFGREGSNRWSGTGARLTWVHARNVSRLSSARDSQSLAKNKAKGEGGGRLRHYGNSRKQVWYLLLVHVSTTWRKVLRTYRSFVRSSGTAKDARPRFSLGIANKRLSETMYLGFRPVWDTPVDMANYETLAFPNRRVESRVF